MPVAYNNGVQLHWEEAGEGTPLLLVMGATYSSAMWWPVIEDFSARHRVIRFDNRGTGKSQCTKVASIADMAADAIAVLDAAGVDQAHVYGVSLGGVVVQELALRYPERVRSLILGCTGILDDNKPRAPKVVQLLVYLPLSLRMKLLGRSEDGESFPPERAAENRRVLAREQTDKRGLIAQQNALRAYSVSREQVRENLTMPALVLHGTADRAVKLAWGQELAETLPNARMITYEGAGHNYLLPAGERANQDVLEFLAQVDALT